MINDGHDYVFLDQVLAVTDHRGVDLAFDGIGAATIMTTLKTLAQRGLRGVVRPCVWAGAGG